jgi:hypothetical protein
VCRRQRPSNVPKFAAIKFPHLGCHVAAESQECNYFVKADFECDNDENFDRPPHWFAMLKSTLELVPSLFPHSFGFHNIIWPKMQFYLLFHDLFG